mmetsp:Transcript_10141/g.10271  ORF Transcript_10141/g.10271 Transcript_10141/m.10271 type:complete len:80 (+) Transcript_10141:628-867(+)
MFYFLEVIMSKRWLFFRELIQEKGVKDDKKNTRNKEEGIWGDICTYNLRELKFAFESTKTIPWKSILITQHFNLSFLGC